MALECNLEKWREGKCVPCEGGVEPLDADAAKLAVETLGNWTLSDDAKLISRKLNCGNFVKAVGKIQTIADLAEQEQHHPDLHLTGYRHLRIDLTTHAIGGLSENDLIVAAKIDAVLGS